MIRYKEVKLIPTLFKLDVYIVGDRYNDNRIAKKDKEQLASIFNRKYGHGYEYWFEVMGVNEVFNTIGSKKSEHADRKRLVVVINPHIETLVHEIIHILWYLADASGLDMYYKSQEWQACMGEYIFTEIKDFKKIPILNKIISR